MYSTFGRVMFKEKERPRTGKETAYERVKTCFFLASLPSFLGLWLCEKSKER